MFDHVYNRRRPTRTLFLVVGPPELTGFSKIHLTYGFDFRSLRREPRGAFPHPCHLDLFLFLFGGVPPLKVSVLDLLLTWFC